MFMRVCECEVYLLCHQSYKIAFYFITVLYDIKRVLFFLIYVFSVSQIFSLSNKILVLSSFHLF